MIARFPLLDVDLGAPRKTTAATPANRRDLVAQMAQHLVREGVPGTEREAMRLLLAGPYRMGDVAALVDDALFTARQMAVAKIMGNG